MDKMQSHIDYALWYSTQPYHIKQHGSPEKAYEAGLRRAEDVTRANASKTDREIQLENKERLSQGEHQELAALRAGRPGTGGTNRQPVATPASPGAHGLEAI